MDDFKNPSDINSTAPGSSGRENIPPAEEKKTIPQYGNTSAEATVPTEPKPAPSAAPPAQTPPVRNGYTVTSAGGYYSSGAGAPQPGQTRPAAQTPPAYTPPTPPRQTPHYSAPVYSGGAATVSHSKKSGVSVGIVILAVVLAAIIGAASGVAAMLAVYPAGTASVNSSSVAEGSGNKVNISVTDTEATIGVAVAEKVTPSVVGIRTTVSYNSYFGTQESSGEGSGVIYTEDGYIITNYHVIEEAVEYGDTDSIQVFLSGDQENGYSATVVGYNISNDLAVIKINGSNLTVIEFADSAELNVGEFCMAVGNPGGLEFMGSATWGIVSGLNRVLSDAGGTALIQTDAAINPGNSGGALVNVNGELIGINSSKLVSEDIEGMGFAIPSNTVKEICDKIISKETDPDPYIGITISQYDAATLEQYGYPVGAWIYSVVSGAPADDAGLQRGDIITKFNGVEITEYTVLLDAISECSPGDTVDVEFFRYSDNEYYTVQLTVGSNNSH